LNHYLNYGLIQSSKQTTANAGANMTNSFETIKAKIQAVETALIVEGFKILAASGFQRLSESQRLTYCALADVIEEREGLDFLTSLEKAIAA
jgi:hypothetical protein